MAWGSRLIKRIHWINGLSLTSIFQECLVAIESCDCKQEILLRAKSWHDESALMIPNSYFQTMCKKMGGKDLFSSKTIIAQTRLCSIEINDDWQSFFRAISQDHFSVSIFMEIDPVCIVGTSTMRWKNILLTFFSLYTNMHMLCKFDYCLAKI